MSPIIGIHTGPGVQAVIYFGNNLELIEKPFANLFQERFSNTQNSLERSKCISHFFPFAQQFIQNLSVCGRSIVQQDNGTRVDPFQKLIEGFLFGRLFVLVPVYVGKAPEEGFIPKLLCHRQICCAVNSLRRPVEFRHGFSGRFFIQIFHALQLFPKIIHRGDPGHIRVGEGVISYSVSFCIISFTRFDCLLMKFPTTKKVAFALCFCSASRIRGVLPFSYPQSKVR